MDTSAWTKIKDVRDLNFMIIDIAEGRVPFDQGMMNGVIQRLKLGVDDLKDLCDRSKTERDRLKEIADKFANSAKVAGNVESFIKNMATSMLVSTDSDRLPGERYMLSLVSKPGFNYTREPMDIDAAKFGSWVKVDYSWDKNKLKEDYKHGALPLELEAVLEEKRSQSAQFRVRKNV